MLRLIIVALTVTSIIAAPRCEGKPADIFFLLDTSSSIIPTDFVKQKQFVSELVQVLDISETKTRVAVSSFSSEYYKKIDFGQINDKQTLKDAIGEIKHQGGNTETGNAIWHMVEQGFATARPGVAHIAFVLTDGQSRDMDKTLNEAEKARKRGIYMFAIGIGLAEGDMDELNGIGSSPKEEFVYRVPSFSVLHTLKRTLAAKACKIEAEKPQGDQTAHACGHNKPVDMIFTFDSPAIGSVKSQLLFTFIANISDKLMTGENNIKTGVMSDYCNDNDVSFEENEKLPHPNKYLEEPKLHSFNNIVKELRHTSFLTENGGRDWSRHVAVLFIDEETENLDAIMEEAKYAKLNDIELFIVNIGNSNKNVLDNIASSPPKKHVWNVNSYQELNTLEAKFAETFC
ncbi:hypothetical protein KUTeg_021088 [Tegillarca granosa]|uniref:VWFA domain-containing protein n=1 Tax=Tegillarca granosa TaxID=220873 RepID=A0ABQ9ECE9_TEGGR|nr:hypothetical protein KUTeg_021088 [Tegillarca granosa]